MENMNNIIAAYLAAKEAKKAAKKEAEKLAEKIFSAAGDAGVIDTDAYSVIISTRSRESVDVAALRAEFRQELLDMYGKRTEYRVITAKSKAASQEGKTA